MLPVTEPPVPPARSAPVQSVDRALRILLAFVVPDQRLSVGELARILGVHKSTASRLAATLVASGFLERDGGEQLLLGPEVARLGTLARSGNSLVDRARPVMEQLAAETGETVTLAVAEAGEAVTIAQAEGSFVVGTRSWLGQRSPLHATSDGKVLLAFGAGTLPEGRLRRCTPVTVTDRRALEAVLHHVRLEGWASSAGDFEDGLHGVAVPVWDEGGRFRAALCVSGPAYRLQEGRVDDVARRCLAAARRIYGAEPDQGGAPR